MELADFQEIPIEPQPLAHFEPIVGTEQMAPTRDLVDRAIAALDGRTIWNINSAAAGGGVAEMLAALLPYARGTGVDVRWLVLSGDDAFYRITKRIHNGLHGSAGDGGLLGKDEAEHYTEVSQANIQHLRERIRPGDAVILHDPQTAGLANDLSEVGARTVWRCHIGHDVPNEFVHRSWEFLKPHLQSVDAFCFTRASYAPEFVPREKLYVIAPSINPFSAKNQEMSADTVRGIVGHLGIISDGWPEESQRTYTRENGTTAVVERHADILHSGPLPTAETPLVVQVSRWDRLKDMVGVLRGFADCVFDTCDAALALVGPSVHAVADDPEGAATYDQCEDVWRGLPHFARNRVLLVTLPMTDVAENAAMVNAIQRHAAIVVQKSLYEGFGLTVTEALWKGKPVIASAVGGINDQIESGVNGLLVDDPTDLEAFGRQVCRLLNDPELAARLGGAGRQTVIDSFLAPRHLSQYAKLLLSI